MAITVHLRALQALEMAVRMGSLKDAARELSITPAAVGQRIKALEDYLDLDLLLRGRSGIRPTRELETAMVHLSNAFRELDTVTDILDFQRVHEIHIAADPDWAEFWLKPRLPQFKKLYPNTQFCINGIGDVPMRIGPSDCEVTFGKTNEDSNIYTLFQDYMLPVTSPKNLFRITKGPDTSGLEGLPLLHLDCYKDDKEAIDWPGWVKKFGLRKSGVERGIHFRRKIHSRESVFANAGFIIYGLALTLDELRDKKVALPFPISMGAWTSHAYQAKFNVSSLRRGQTAKFRDWLVQEGAATTAELIQLTTDSHEFS